MRSLGQFISESVVTESRDKYMLVWDHFDPEYVNVVSGDIKKLRKFLEKDYDAQIYEFETRDTICGISWNDEDARAWDIPGRNLNDIKKLDLENIQTQLDNGAVRDEYARIESYLYGAENEWDEDADKMTAKDFLNGFIEIIEDSVVDGDSGWAISLIDIKKKAILLGNGNVNFVDAEEYMKYLSNEE